MKSLKVAWRLIPTCALLFCWLTAASPALARDCGVALSLQMPTATIQCRSCRVENPEKAYDGDRETFAAVVFSAGPAWAPLPVLDGDFRFVLAAPEMLSLPAGRDVGSVILLAPSKKTVIENPEIATYLDGVEQERFKSGNNINTGFTGSTTEYLYTANTEFDAVEVRIPFLSNDREPATIKVFEICA